MGVVDPVPGAIYGELPNEFVKPLPKDAALKPLPALDEKELSSGVEGFGVVEMDDKPLLPYMEPSLLGPGGGYGKFCGTDV